MTTGEGEGERRNQGRLGRLEEGGGVVWWRRWGWVNGAGEAKKKRRRRRDGIPLPPLDKPNRSRCASAGRNSPSVSPPSDLACLVPPLPSAPPPPSPPHHHLPLSSTLESNGACYLNGERAKREAKRGGGLATVVGGWMWQSATPEGLSRWKCGEQSLLSVSPCLSSYLSSTFCPLLSILHGILFLPFRSYLSHTVSPVSNPHTCSAWRCLLARLRRVARRGCGGTAGVAWTEINIRRASTYSCPLAHTLPVSLMFVSPAVHPSFSHPPRTSTAFLVRRTEGTPRSRLCPALYLGFTGRPHPSPCPPSLIHSATPPFPRGWTNTHTREQKHTYVHVQTRSEERERTLWQTKHFCTGCVSTYNGWLYNAGRILENSLIIKE